MGGRRRDRGRKREVLTRCKAGRCRPLPAAPVPEAGGGSSEPKGGCHAAPAPPPRCDLRRSSSPTASVRGEAGGHSTGMGPRAHALCRSGPAPTREGRSAAPTGTAHHRCRQSRERTNQGSQVLRTLRTTNRKPFEYPRLGTVAPPPNSSLISDCGRESPCLPKSSRCVGGGGCHSLSPLSSTRLPRTAPSEGCNCACCFLAGK